MTFSLTNNMYIVLTLNMIMKWTQEIEMQLTAGYRIS